MLADSLAFDDIISARAMGLFAKCFHLPWVASKNSSGAWDAFVAPYATVPGKPRYL